MRNTTEFRNPLQKWFFFSGGAARNEEEEMESPSNQFFVIKISFRQPLSDLFCNNT